MTPDGEQPEAPAGSRPQLDDRLLGLLLHAVRKNISDDVDAKKIQQSVELTSALAMSALANSLFFKEIMASDSGTEEALIGLTTLNDITGICAQLIAIDAVQQGRITRRRAAEILQVHENTVARWVKDESYANKLRDTLHYYTEDHLISQEYFAYLFDGKVFKRGEVAQIPSRKSPGTANLDRLLYEVAKFVNARLRRIDPNV